jgi:hypothetical protein
VLQPVRNGSKPLVLFRFPLVGFVLAFWRFGKIHEIAWPSSQLTVLAPVISLF